MVVPELSVAGRRIHYLDVGVDAGSPPLVLLHAFPLSSKMWAPQIACLAAGHRVVAPDLAGFGSTDPLGDPSTTTMEAMADDVVALVETLSLGPVVVGGLSMGGYVAFDLLRRRPDLLAGVILADTRAAADAPEVVDRRTAQQEQINGGHRESVIESLLGGLLGDSTRSGRPALVDQVRSLMVAQPDEAYIGALEAMLGRADSTSLLGGVSVPTLVIVGAEDALSTPEAVVEWQPSIPGSTLVVLDGAGHLSNLEASDGFNAAVIDFVDGIVATA